MAELQTLNVQARTGLGKEANRKLRQQSLVPGVYYNAKGENIALQVQGLPLSKLFHKIGTSRVFDLVIGEETAARPALIWKLQHDPVKTVITHVDFLGVDLDKDIKVHVPVEVTGKAKGLIKGGRLEIFRETVEVLCKPLSIPDAVVVDVTDLDLNESYLISELPAMEGVKFVYDDNFAVVGVVVLADQAEGEGGAEAAAE